jgi:hypothetical protein
MTQISSIRTIFDDKPWPAFTMVRAACGAEATALTSRVWFFFQYSAVAAQLNVADSGL